MGQEQKEWGVWQGNPHFPPSVIKVQEPSAENPEQTGGENSPTFLETMAAAVAPMVAEGLQARVGKLTGLFGQPLHREGPIFEGKIFLDSEGTVISIMGTVSLRQQSISVSSIERDEARLLLGLLKKAVAENPVLQLLPRENGDASHNQGAPPQ